MSKSDEAKQEFADEFLYTNKAERAFTALISEHYVAKEEVDKMAAEKCKKCKYRGLPDSINEALNSGDGVYRP